jgi:TonB family protein
LAAVTSLVIHAGVVGFALQRTSPVEQLANAQIEMQLLPQSIEIERPAIAPTPLLAIDAPQVAALRSAPVSTRARPNALARGAVATSQSASAALSSDPLPRFAIAPSPSAKARFVLPMQPALTPMNRGSSAPSADDAASSTVAPLTLSASQVSVPARLLVGVPVIYPAAARAAEVEAGVVVEIVIDEHGHVVDARTLEPIGYGLDQAALTAVRAYRFSSARRAGQPVRVRMRWNVQFRLR